MAKSLKQQAQEMCEEQYMKSEITRARSYSLSCVQLLATPWTVACQAPLSVEFSRQEYWNG